jgi:hypothetical protein
MLGVDWLQKGDQVGVRRFGFGRPGDVADQRRPTVLSSDVEGRVDVPEGERHE